MVNKISTRWQYLGMLSFGVKNESTNEKNLLYLNYVIITWLFLIMIRSGDIETNPGPDGTEFKVVTYNVRGLKEYNKRKRFLNTSCNLLKTNPNTIINIQETHLDESDKQNFINMWRGGWALSPGGNKSRGCITLFDSTWELVEKIEDPSGRVCIVTLKKGFGTYSICNVYAPNENSLNFFESVFLRTIQARDKFDSKCIISGDFNLVLDSTLDSVHRAQTGTEKITAQFISESVKALNLIDCHRFKNKRPGGYTWNRGKCYSRLDYIVADKELVEVMSSIETDWALDRSDHAAISGVFLVPAKLTRGRGLPRIDSYLLDNKEYRLEILEKLKLAVQTIPNSWSPDQQWEFLKVTIRSIFWEISAKTKKREEVELSSLREQINTLKKNKASLLERACLSQELERQIDRDIAGFETELSEFFEAKSKKLANKARVQWFNEGEKSNKYFLNLITKRQKEMQIQNLQSQHKTADNQKDLEKLVVEFYSNLYEEDKTLIKDDYSSFYDPDTPMLNDRDREDLDKPITLEELGQTLKGCKESAPGPDGIPYRVYKTYWEVLGPFSLNCWNQSRERGILPESQRMSSITLLPKEGKDTSQIGNWRPITLTNCDLKIYTKLLANRVSRVLDKIIHPSQTAYIPGRSVHDNLRMFEFYRSYCQEHNIDGILMSMDAKKAFDSVDHNYMFTTFKRYGFSNEFIDIVKMIYKDIKADILVNGFRTVAIAIERCVKQGDAFSCAAFIIILDPLIRNINRNEKIKPIMINTPLSNYKTSNKTGGFADDVGTLTMGDRVSINEVFKEYDKFSNRSGVRINESKTEIMRLAKCNNFVSKIYSIETDLTKFTVQSVESIKICGIVFSNNERIKYNANVTEKIERLKKKVLSWQYRGLSLGGKVLIVKTFGVSQLIYTMQVCNYSTDDLQKAESFIFNFLWSKDYNNVKAKDRISRVKMKQDYENGGLKVPDLRNLNIALKLRQFFRSVYSNHPIKWLQRYHTEIVDYDYPVQQEYSRLCKNDNVIYWAQVGMNRLTDVMRESIKSSNNPEYIVDLIASTDVLEYLNRRKLPLIKTWFRSLFEQGIENLKQLINESIYPRNEYLATLSSNVLTCIPQRWIQIIKDNIHCDDSLDIRNNICIDDKQRPVGCRNVTVSQIRSRILNKPDSTIYKYIERLGVPNHDDINPFSIAKSIHNGMAQRIFKFRLLHLDIFCNERMARFKMIESENCNVCGRVETIKHALWECDRAKRVWVIMNNIIGQLGYSVQIEFKNLFVGFSPTLDVIESIVTRLSQLIMSYKRETMILDHVILQTILDYTILNYNFTKKYNKKSLSEWRNINEHLKLLVIT